MTPTLYLSNVASRLTPGRHGPGRLWTIQARPPHWARGLGRVAACAPISEVVRPYLDAALAERKAGIVDGPDFEAYREAFIGHLAQYDLAPGALRGYPWEAMRDGIPVADGDTLVCTCSVAEARAKRCHRSWCCEPLAKAGWSVVIDGVPFVSGGTS